MINSRPQALPILQNTDNVVAPFNHQADLLQFWIHELRYVNLVLPMYYIGQVSKASQEQRIYPEEALKKQRLPGPWATAAAGEFHSRCKNQDESQRSGYKAKQAQLASGQGVQEPGGQSV